VVYVVPHGRASFPDDLEPDEYGLVALGGELTAETVIEAYRKGIFPWTGDPPIPWFSPDPRLVLFPGWLRVSRSLAKVIRRGLYEVRFDCDFDGTIRGCAGGGRAGQDGTWITENMVQVYGELFARGVAHTVEVYQDGELCGGLYGVALGRAFFGESMFARRSNASKVALEALCRRLVELDFHFIDCQQVTAHLLRMGAVPIARTDFLRRLRVALAYPPSQARW
jgi:leucyl/phenylalanyl-tRNA---protein transferase